METGLQSTRRITGSSQCRHVVCSFIERQLVDRRLNTKARSDVFFADWVVAIDLGHLAKRLEDEDEGDEYSEALFGEASDVADEETQVEGDHEQ